MYKQVKTLLSQEACVEALLQQYIPPRLVQSGELLETNWNLKLKLGVCVRRMLNHVHYRIIGLFLDM